jgi:hypothetical protein
MAINRGKRISELTELTSASLNTTIVGVDNGTTYKIELDTLADAVASRVNILDRERLQSLESVTSSFEVNGRSIVSSSAQITALGFISSSITIPIGTISSSTQISDFGFISSSHTDITSLNSFTASQSSLNTAFTNGISARLQTSSFNDFSASVHQRILDATNEQSFNGLISGSSQLTSSFDERYVLSGSITQTTWDNIANKPNDIVSSSAQITAFGFVSSSTSINTGSLDLIGFNTSAGVSVGAGQLAWNNTDGTLDLGMKGGNVVQQIGQEIFYEVRNETGIQIPNGTAVYANGVTAGSGRITAAPYVADGSIREVRFLGIATENITSGVNGFVTHFGYVRDLDTRGTTASSIAVGDETWAVGDILYVHPTIAGKLTKVKPQHEVTAAIIITRHQSSGVIFVRPSSAGHLEDVHDISINTGSLSNGQVLSYNSTSGLWVNANTISASSQLTSSFDGRYVQTGSFNTLTASFNSFTASAQSVTTGSNSFNGTQTITGSLTVTNGNVIASQITANTSSLYLTSGSNLYVQNNGLVEITGSLTATSITGSIAATNGVISGSSQLTTSFPSKTTGSWTVPAGASTHSFTVDWNHSYQLWVIGNIPNGIISWIANVNVTNSNVPIVGSQYGWYYVDGNALVLTSIPNQIVGVNGAISTSSFATTTSNTFEFGITNNSGTPQTINYGYIKIS